MANRSLNLNFFTFTFLVVFDNTWLWCKFNVKRWSGNGKVLSGSGQNWSELIIRILVQLSEPLAVKILRL